MGPLWFSTLPSRSKPSACFSQLLGKKQGNWLVCGPWGPASQGSPRDQALRNNTFLWLLLADCVSCPQWLAWLDYALSRPFLRRAGWFPLLSRRMAGGGAAWN